MITPRLSRLLYTNLPRSSTAAVATLVPSSTPISYFSSSSVLTPSIPETEVPSHSKSHPDIDDSSKNSIQMHTSTMYANDPHAVIKSEDHLPDPVLPGKPEEISSLDPAMTIGDPYSTLGSQRTVVVRQDPKNPSQAPSHTRERNWVISFQDDGAPGNNWSNPLMGWVSGNDAMASTQVIQMKFQNAKEAVYFAKKRGWKYQVEKPLMRESRSDGAQYQDNFLPQSIAYKVRSEKNKCDHWHRPAAGASHYFRPLKYHGDGLVRQHGADQEAPTDPDAESYYKTR